MSRTPAPVRLSAADPDLAGGVADGLRGCGSVLVEGVDVRDDDALLSVVAHAATPSTVGNGGGPIYDVTPRPAAERADLSSTGERFPLHTDSTFLPHPHDVVALGCQIAPADAGGESHLLALDVALAGLPDDTIAALAEPAFPFPLVQDGARAIVPVPVLTRSAERWSVRYRHDHILGAARDADGKLEPRHGAALEAFADALAETDRHAVLSLRPGDVLLLDNRHLLHGRTAITGGARRLLRRVKAFN